MKVIAEELENCSRVVGLEADIHSLEKLGSVNALSKRLLDYQFRCKESGTPSWKKASTLRP